MAFYRIFVLRDLLLESAFVMIPYKLNEDHGARIKVPVSPIAF